MGKKTVYTVSEVAKLLGVSSSTIYRMEKKGLISSHRTSDGRRCFEREIISRYLKDSKESRDIYGQRKSHVTSFSVKEQKATFIVKPDIFQTPELFFYSDSIVIYNADILKIDVVEENSIDLIVTSPPYNVDIKYNSHDDSMAYDEYLSFTQKWLSKCYKFLKNDGRFCLNVPLDKNKGGQQSVCADITYIAKQIGFKYHSTIIWNEQNISRRTAWGSWMSATAPYVIAPVEVIIVLYKQRWKKTSGSGRSDITKEEFLEWTNGVWNFSGESKKRVGHPAPFPLELPRRCIKLFSFVGDVVLDPFLGSGTTLLACLQTGRKGIGVEIDRNYCELAKKRLLTEGQINQLKLIVTSEGLPLWKSKFLCPLM